MSTEFKLGDVVRSRLTRKEMAIYHAGPVEVGGVPLGFGPGSRKPNLSNDHVLCIWFEGKQVKRDRFKKSELDFVRHLDAQIIDEGSIVKLASGGPRMLVTLTGAMEVGGSPVGIASGAPRTRGTVRDDLVACKWEGCSKPEKFNIAVLQITE
ncbi:hypothetical protein ACIPIX_12480 [Pseudomonas protegens]|uniref:hypothetical protein n=1 Tax=Pseudomonas protegens TaxID=380021 RepID=UPI0037FC4EC5